MGFALALLKYNPFWKTLEKYKVSEMLPKMMGEKSYKLLWEPLIIKKFGPYANDISLAWFWARITKRTPSLAYPEGGFLEFANALVSEIKKKHGKIQFSYEVKNISTQNNQIKVDDQIFDKVIVTLPSFTFAKIAPQLPNDYKEKLLQLRGISAVNLVVRLKKPFFRDHTYWLNICDIKFPVTAVVEHTNFMDKKFYNNEHILYLGNYVPQNHPFMKMNREDLLKKYDVLLSRINEDYKSQIIETHLFLDYFAQPIIPINYSKIVPPFETPLQHVYLANMQQVYPWDRGTNYAVEMGEKAADLILNR
jgi:protoporphyrinogen oxidase